MLNRKCVTAAAMAAAAVIVCAQHASANPGGDGSDRAKWILFSGGDLWRNGGFAHGGVLWSPDGVDREGFTLKAVISGGSYRYLSGALGNAQVTGRELAVQLMPGARFKRGTLEFTVFAGLDVQDHRLSPDDPSSKLRGSDVGARIGFDLWYEPTTVSMLTASGALSSIGGGYSARVAAGWRLLNRFYIGPEVQTFSSDDYRQTRFGFHLSGFKTGEFEWSAAIGWANDNDDRSGAYGRLGVSTRR